MPSIGNTVKFHFGTQAEFDQISYFDADTLYFITDKSRIFIGESEYTRPIVSGSVDPSTSQIVFPKDSIYIQDVGNSQTIWYYSYDSSEDAYTWKTVSALDDVMALAKLDTTSEDIRNIKAGQLYKYDGWVSLKLISNSDTASSHMELVDTGKRAEQINSNADHDHYATAAAVYMWNRKFIEQPPYWGLPQLLSSIGDYDPLGVVFSIDEEDTGNREYYLCIYRDEINNEFKNMIYLRFPTMSELESAIADVEANAIMKLEADPISGYKSQDNATVGVLNQVVYSIASNSFFKCTTRGGSSINPWMTWTKIHTTANVTYWDYQTSSANNFEVPTTFAGALGDIVVVTTSSGSGGYATVNGGEIWQCYKTIRNSMGGSITYYWRKINQSIRCMWSQVIPTTSDSSDLWNIRYVDVNGHTQMYQLTNITTLPDDTKEYTWTRIITSDDYSQTLLVFDADPVNGETENGANYGMLNQCAYSLLTNKIFKCTTCTPSYSYPSNSFHVVWEEVDRTPKVTYWNYVTSAQHSFSADGTSGQIGDIIVITTQDLGSEDVQRGGSIWICYQTVFWSDTQSTQYFWREIRDCISCQYIQSEPTAATSANMFDLRWLGDYAALGQQDDLFRLFQNIGSYGYSNIWKEILTQNSVQQDISSAQYPNTYVPSSLAAKKYAERVSGIHDVNPVTGKITTYDGQFHDEDYEPHNQLYKIFDPDNDGAIFIAKDAYNGGTTAIRLTRYEEAESIANARMARPPIGAFDDDPFGQLYFVRHGSGTNDLNLYIKMQGTTSVDKRIAWYNDLANKADIEEGTITQDTTAWYTDPSEGYEISGEYTLIGDMCFLRAHADLVWDPSFPPQYEGDQDRQWQRVYYTLPVAATQSSTTIGLRGNDAYSVATGVQQNISVLELRQLGSDRITSGGTVYFTLIYKYT